MIALTLGLAPLAPWALELLIKLTVAMTLILPFVSVVAMFTIWLERKAAGHIQSRLGPMRVGGWHGWAQSLADGIKLIVKEDLIPAQADGLLFRLAPYLAFAPALAAFLGLAWSRDLSGLTREFNVGVFFILAVLGVEVLSVILAGWSSNNKWSIYGAMREACQLVSYEIPLGLAILVAVMVAGSLNMFEISCLQSGDIHQWLVFHDPFNMLAFVLYYVAALASCKRAPFDLPESESELVAGFHTEYSGIRFSFFFFSEYAAMFVVSAIQISLWLGAWYDPFGLVAHLEKLSHSASGEISNMKLAVAANLLGLTVFILKAFALIFTHIWLRWTLPRLRIDQVLYLCMKVLLPAACANLLGAAFYLWLVDPSLQIPALATFQLLMQWTLAGMGILAMLLLAGWIFWAFLQRNRPVAKTLFENSRPLPTLPGA